MKSIDANVRRGMQSLAKALDEKTSVHRAMFRNGLGWVDFVWGSEGQVKVSGKTKGAMGISHILEARQRKDGMSEAEVTHLLGRIVRTIAQGAEIRRVEVGNIERVVVAHDGIEAVLTKRAGSNS
jgi:phage-Barnase-EndoU-ColicinE5/D-RelE like nuclease1